MHFNRKEIFIRQRLRNLCSGHTHTETYFKHARRIASKLCREIQRLRSIGNTKARKAIIQPTRLLRRHPSRPHHETADWAMQIGIDTHDFANALKAAVRQDVDVIVVSEMRDQESIAAALTAAETGHLVISTLHTWSAVGTLDRVVDIFPPAQQPQIITQLASALVGVVNQKLLPRADAPGRVMASEVMVMTPALAAIIRDHRFEQLQGLIQVGAVHGMHTMDSSLYHLLTNDFITAEDALLHARDPGELKEDFKEFLRAQEKARR